LKSFHDGVSFSKNFRKNKKLFRKKNKKLFRKKFYNNLKKSKENMDAYNLIFMEKMAIIIGNFNIMSHKTSKFAIPQNSYVHSENTGEERKDWVERYKMIIKELSSLSLDIFCLEEVTGEFYNMLPISFNEMYFVHYKPDGNLLTLIKKTICAHPPIPIELEKFHHTKLAAYTILCRNGVFLTIVNAHLIGDPKASEERKNVLKYLIQNLQNVIIIGDFNQSVETFLDGDFQNFLDRYNMAFENQNVMTSYSRYDINPKGFVTGIKKEQWENIDNILYSRQFLLLSKDVFPQNGLYGKSVPYFPLGDFSYRKNFVEWPSDHTLNLYEFRF